jgi:SAM-dependent methyltransferase
MSGDPTVKAQYEAYPYPRRDPRDEARRLITGSPSHWREIDHYVFAGARDWSRPFRALVAGGGTGDALVMLAQQLATAGCPADIVYVDLSSRSRAVAEARIAARGIGFVRFHTGSLLDLAALEPEPFDYVDCCGVLHHLPDPAAGLAALAARLRPDGGMGLMLYGALGRTGVYPLQAALRALAPEADPAARVAVAKRLLRDLPASNWLNRNPFLTSHRADDAALYDLLLHSTDRAYRVGEVYALLAGAGLTPTVFVEPARYDPLSYLGDETLRRRVEGLPPPARQALAEELSGAMKVHSFYAVPAARAATAVVDTAGDDWVPVWREGDGADLLPAVADGVITVDLDGHKARFPLPHGVMPIAKAIDGRRSVAEIHDAAGPADDRFRPRFDRLYAVLNGLNLLLARRA